MENNISKEIYSSISDAKAISTNDPERSFEMCKKAYNLSKKNNFKKEEGYALIGMCIAFRAISELNNWLEYAYNALDIFEEMEDILGKIRALNLIGIAYFYNSMYEQALKNLLQALELLESNLDKYLLSSVLNNIGEVYRESGNYDAALEYYKRAINISIEINSKTNEASLLNNIGEIYFLQNKYDVALEYYNDAYGILYRENDMVLLGDVENKIGKVNFINNNYERAYEYYNKALYRLEKINNVFYAIDVLINMGLLYFKVDSHKAFSYFEKAISYAEKCNAKKKLSLIYKTISDFYDKKSEYRYALEYYKKYHQIDQEVSSQIVGNKLEIIKIELSHLKESHDYEKVKMVNQRLEIEISNQRVELEKQQILNSNLQEKAFIDELTRISNRRGINISLNKVWDELSTTNKNLILFIIDIDYFKKYNDFWGHSKGDECLIQIVNCLKNIQENRNDFLGRYGGEEFVYFSKDLNYKEAFELGLNLKNKVEKLNIKYTSDNESKVVTISIGGVIGSIEKFKSITETIDIADKELYKAKENGRNTVFLMDMGI